MQTLRYKYVIIGSGLAGRTVANQLESGSFVVLERGEKRDYGEIYKRFEDKMVETGDFYLAEEYAYGSDLPWNKRPQLSKWNYTKYAMIAGGASMWWGGNTRRFSRETFSIDGPVFWPFGLEELIPYYLRAEKLLNVCGDTEHPNEPAPTYMPGAKYWRDAFSPYFKNTYLSNVALNKNPNNLHQGVCKGRSQCTICREDAKAHPGNIFPEQNTLYDAMALQILFDEEKAVAVECYDGKQVFNIEFDFLIVAANGIETPLLFGRSDLPSSVRKEFIGKFYQDHGHLEIFCKIDKPLLYGNVGGLSHVHVPDISTYYQTSLGDIEISAFALTHEPPKEAFKAGMNIDLLRSEGVNTFLDDLRGCFGIFCELEIPPTAGFYVDLDGESPTVIDSNYPEVINVFDDVVGQAIKKLTLLGVSVLGSNRKYRAGYNSHHISGTMNCSPNENGVVDSNMRVIGTRNVFIAGSSVIPRAGGHGPTLTIVALAERLSDHLKSLV